MAGMNKLLTREEIISSNLGLVHSCAGRFRGRGIEYDDLFQAGSMGLVKAVDGFDHSKGVKLSTYAVPVILGEIRRLFRDGGTVKVSRSLKETSLKLYHIRERLAKELGHEPSIEQLAAASGFTTETVVEATLASQPIISLTSGSEDGTNIEFDIKVSGVEEELSDRLSINEVLQDFEIKDRNLIKLRYFQNKTQAQTAKILGMSQVQVSRKEKKLLLKMREKLSD